MPETIPFITDSNMQGANLPTVISLFSGAGGLDLGFSRAGFKIAVSQDISTAAIETHRLNFPDSYAILGDISFLGAEEIANIVAKVIPVGSSIGVIGGPPCQGFSVSNRRSNPNDPRNELVNVYLQTVKALQQQFCVEFTLFENVMGLKSKKHISVFNGIVSELRRLGFHSKSLEMSALDYGVPQVRHRLLIAGFRHKSAADLFSPVPAPLADYSVQAAIYHLPEPTFYRRGLLTDDIPYHPNHWTMRPKSHRFNGEWIPASGSRSFRRLDASKPSPTVAYGNREIHVHPRGDRRLSILEAMILQGFPESFILKGTLSDQVEMVSNAVPPPMAEILARAVADRVRASHRENPMETVTDGS